MEPAAKSRKLHELSALGRFRNVSARTVSEILRRFAEHPEVLHAVTQQKADYAAAVVSTSP